MNKKLSDYILENINSNNDVWIFARKGLVVHGTCDEIFKMCGSCILNSKILNTETELFGDVNIYIKM